MFVDSHCHLLYEKDSHEREAQLARARAVGVTAFLNICCRRSEMSPLQAFSQKNPDIFFSLGIHPHEAKETCDEISMAALRAELVQGLSDPKAVGLGETGLDYYYDHSPRDVQKELFALHMELSLEHDIPVIIHTRDAEEDTLALIKHVGQERLRGVLHCFSGSRHLMDEALALGLYISASGIVTFKKADDLKVIFTDVPLDRLLIETDAPYLAPVPFRGKSNESGFMVHTAQALADLKGCAVEDIARHTTQNFYTLFNKARADICSP